MYLEVKDLKKSYGKDQGYVQVLKGVSTGVEKGQMCVIQGTSGSGKSTLLNCIGRLDNIDSGSVKVDGKEVGGLSADKLADYRRDNLGFIFQFYNLVPNLTVRENIQVCEYLTKDPLDMEELLETLGLSEHRNKFPSQLSGGQRQLVSFARTLISDPKILILDEATSSIDAKTEKELQKGLQELLKGRTSFIIAHRLSTIKNCDKIMFISNKGITEAGTHDELMAKKGDYYKLCMAQK